MRGLLAKRKEESQCDSVPHGKRQGNIRAITAYEKKEGGNQSESQDRPRSHHPIGHIVVKALKAGVRGHNDRMEGDHRAEIGQCTGGVRPWGHIYVPGECKAVRSHGATAFPNKDNAIPSKACVCYCHTQVTAKPGPGQGPTRSRVMS